MFKALRVAVSGSTCRAMARLLVIASGLIFLSGTARAQTTATDSSEGITPARITAISNFVLQQGRDSVIEAQWLQVMGVPYFGTRPFAVRYLSVVHHDWGGDDVRRVIVISFTNRRYLFFMATSRNEDGKEVYGTGAVVDEQSKIVGGVELFRDVISATNEEDTLDSVTTESAFWITRLHIR